MDARKKIKQKHRTKFRVQFFSPGWRRLLTVDKLPSGTTISMYTKYSSFFLPCDRGRSKVDIQHTAGVHDRLRAAPPEFVAELPARSAVRKKGLLRHNYTITQRSPLRRSDAIRGG